MSTEATGGLMHQQENPVKHTSRIGTMVVGMAVVAAAIAAGCAGAPLRTEASTSGIRAAEEVGASKVPKAALHLQLAREELAKAKAMSANGDKDEATSLLARSEADAELAVALSREDAEKTEAQAAVERVRQLRKETK
jgi:hypothetical protein